MAKELRMDDQIVKEMIGYISESKDLELSIDEDDTDDVQAVKDIVTGAFEFACHKLAENRSKEEETTLDMGEFVTLVLSYREGADNCYQLSAVPGAEAKKIIKDDADTEE